MSLIKSPSETHLDCSGYLSFGKENILESSEEIAEENGD